MRNKTEQFFEARINYILSKTPNISIHELAIKALHKQTHSDLNEFYLDCAIEKLKVKKQLSPKKVIQKTKLLNIIPIAA